MADQGRRGVSSTVIAAAVRAALRRDPGHFRGVETHPATERALTRAHRELSELDRYQLAALSQQSPRAADVVRVHGEVAAALEAEFSNEQQLARAAAAAVRADPSAARRQLGPVIVFLPQSVTGSQAGLLRAVADATEATIIAGATGAEDADATVRASLRRLGADLDASVAPAGTAPNRPGRHGAGPERLRRRRRGAPHGAGCGGRRPGGHTAGPMRHLVRSRDPVCAPSRRRSRRRRDQPLRRHGQHGGDIAAGPVAAGDAGPARPGVLPARRDGVAGRCARGHQAARSRRRTRGRRRRQQGQPQLQGRAGPQGRPHRRDGTGHQGPAARRDGSHEMAERSQRGVGAGGSLRPGGVGHRQLEAAA